MIHYMIIRLMDRHTLPPSFTAPQLVENYWMGKLPIATTQVRTQDLRSDFLRRVLQSFDANETLLKRVIRQMPFLCFVRYIYPRNTFFPCTLCADAQGGPPQQEPFAQQPAMMQAHHRQACRTPQVWTHTHTYKHTHKYIHTFAQQLTMMQAHHRQACRTPQVWTHTHTYKHTHTNIYTHSLSSWP